MPMRIGGKDDGLRLPSLRNACPSARTLVFTAYETERLVVGALRAGATGYLLKGAPAAEIARAVRVVHAGGAYLEPRVALAAMSAPPAALLSAREREVLKHVADGLPTKQIAAALGIAERTVKFHLASLFLKLDAENRAQAVAVAGRRGLL